MEGSRTYSSRGYDTTVTTTLLDDWRNSLGVWMPHLNYRCGSVVLRVVSCAPTFYRSIQEDNKNHVPEYSPAWWEVWIGAGGGGVVGGAYEVWNAGSAYNAGQMVYYNGYLYTALAPSTGIVPDANPATWQQLPWRHPYLGEWDITYNYLAGQAVWYGGSIWMAVINNIGTVPGTNPAVWQNVLGTTPELVENFTYTGSNLFTLAGVPINPTTVKAFIDSYHMIQGPEYTLIGNQLTIIPAGLGFIPNIGEIVTVYWS